MRVPRIEDTVSSHPYGTFHLTEIPRLRDRPRLAAHGHRNADIARFLVLAPGTVTAHLKNIYAKLEVHSRLELANLLRELGEYEDPGP